MALLGSIGRASRAGKAETADIVVSPVATGDIAVTVNMDDATFDSPDTAFWCHVYAYNRPGAVRGGVPESELTADGEARNAGGDWLHIASMFWQGPLDRTLGIKPYIRLNASQVRGRTIRAVLHSKQATTLDVEVRDDRTGRDVSASSSIKGGR